MRLRLICALCACVLTLPLFGSAHAETREQLTQQVRDAENAFAATMAARDHKAFATFIAEDAIFFGGDTPARGKAAVVESWKGLYEKPNAPFSWSSETVEVLDSGKLAHSSGPVLNAKGERVATFNSIWRRESDGSWKVVFDKGCETCRCADAKKQRPPDDFRAAQKVFSDAAPKLLAAANANDVNAVKSTYGEPGKACKNCHDTFRAPEDQDR